MPLSTILTNLFPQPLETCAHLDFLFSGQLGGQLLF